MNSDPLLSMRIAVVSRCDSAAMVPDTSDDAPIPRH